MNISILYPPGIDFDSFKPISDTTWHDLGFDQILPLVTRDATEQGVIRYVMTHLCDDPITAQYRIDVFDDLIRHPELRLKIQTLLDRISQLEDRMSLRNTFEQTDSIWTLMRRLREIDEYIDCVETIGTSLSDHDLHSEALKNLEDYISQIQEASFFQVLKKDIQGLRVMTSKVKSITLGINLDENYETESVGIVSLNDRPFTKTGLLSNFTKRLIFKDHIQKGTDWDGRLNYHYVDTSPVSSGSKLVEKATIVLAGAANPLMGVLLGMSYIKNAENARQTVRSVESVMNQMMSDSVQSLKEVLSKYVTVDIHSITDLIPEFLYYVRWADYIQKLQDQGYTFNKATALKIAARPADIPQNQNNIQDIANLGRMEPGSSTKTPPYPQRTDSKLPISATIHAQGIYNMKLATSGNTPASEIVTNDLTFTPDFNCYLLTGANRGGKTTITQAVGQAMILAQGGLYIPGNALYFLPVDSVFTHFPADEDKTMDYGRLGEECSRFRQIYTEATSRSLILLNESFSTTSFEEGYYIAYDAVRALLLKGCRTIFNTHMHKLAREVDAINASQNTSCHAASLIVKNEGSKRSYKLEIAPPEGTSYARDIAEKYGLTYEQLTSQ